MLWKRVLMFAVAATMAGPLMAQQSSGSTKASQPTRANGQSGAEEMRFQQRALDGHFWQNEQSRRLLERGDNSPAAVRAHLAEAWRHLGMSPEAAKTVASAYDYKQAHLADSMSIKGKSDEEVASMLQSALSRKQYAQANHLLIDYERGRLHLPSGSPPR